MQSKKSPNLGRKGMIKSKKMNEHEFFYHKSRIQAQHLHRCLNGRNTKQKEIKRKENVIEFK